MYPVEVREEPARRVVGVAHEGAYHQIGGAFRRLSDIVSERGLWPQVNAFMGVYLDDPNEVPPSDLRSMAAVSVPEQMPLPDGLEQMHLAGGRHAVLRMSGPYDDLPAAYQWLYGQWLPGSGERLRDAPSLEIYLNDPGSVASAELLTEICVPVG